MPRLLVLCRHPYHVPFEDSEDWLKQELTTVLRRDELDGASLTRLANPSAQWTRAYDWLIELRFHGLQAEWVEWTTCESSGRRGADR